MNARGKIFPALPFRHRLGDGEDYTVQNMLIRQVAFPVNDYNNQLDLVGDVWSDRAYDTWQAANVVLMRGSKQSWEARIRDCSPEHFIEWCRTVTGGAALTGARLVRFTNVSSAYPVYRIDYYARGKGSTKVELTSDDNAPNVTQPEVQRGRFRY